MANTGTATVSAKASGTFAIGGDLPVNRLGFGAMRITGDGIWGEPSNREQAKQVLRRAVELDINFIDTADAYGPDVSEQLIGEALAPYKKGVVIATKGGLTRQGPNVWTPLGQPEYLQQQVEMSLRYLKQERIEISCSQPATAHCSCVISCASTSKNSSSRTSPVYRSSNCSSG